jgi:hypothetical protein
MILMKVGPLSYDFIVSDRTINILKQVWANMLAPAIDDGVFHQLFCELVWQANKERLPVESQVRDDYSDLMQPPAIEDSIRTHVAHLLEEPSFLYN